MKLYDSSWVLCSYYHTCSYSLTRAKTFARRVLCADSCLLCVIRVVMVIVVVVRARVVALVGVMRMFIVVK